MVPAGTLSDWSDMPEKPSGLDRIGPIIMGPIAHVHILELGWMRAIVTMLNETIVNMMPLNPFLSDFVCPLLASRSKPCRMTG